MTGEFKEDFFQIHRQGAQFRQIPAFAHNRPRDIRARVGTRIDRYGDHAIERWFGIGYCRYTTDCGSDIIRRNIGHAHQNTPAAFTVEQGAVPILQQNVFLGMRPDVFPGVDPAIRLKLEHHNWFVAGGPVRP